LFIRAGVFELALVAAIHANKAFSDLCILNARGLESLDDKLMQLLCGF
jgi:hypothetical protein